MDLDAKTARRESWVGNFVLTWLVRFGFFFAFHELQPIFAPYLNQLGASSSTIGGVMATFAITATLARPPVGFLVDRFGRKHFLAWGLVIIGLATLGYVWAPSVAAIFLLRVVQGVGWSASTTAVATLAADIAPLERRGELIGYAGMASNLGATLGPMVGFAALEHFGPSGPFLSSFAFVLVSLFLTAAVKEPRLADTTPYQPKRWLDFVFVSESLSVAVTAGFLSFGYGGVSSFVPLYALQKGLANPGLYFALYATSLLLSRFLAGRLSDRVGRRSVILPGYTLYLVGMVVFALAPSPLVLLAAAVLMGLGFGTAHPVLMTLAIDQVPPSRRGSSVSQFQLFYDLGIGLGSIGVGFILDATGQNYPATFLIATAVGLLGLIGYWFLDKGGSSKA
jgi:MFS family permease